jgi:hypothetical protein
LIAELYLGKNTEKFLREYFAPTYVTETAKYYADPTYTSKAAEYYTTKAPEYYTVASSYTTTKAPEYYTSTIAASYYSESRKY